MASGIFVHPLAPFSSCHLHSHICFPISCPQFQVSILLPKTLWNQNFYFQVISTKVWGKAGLEKGGHLPRTRSNQIQLVLSALPHSLATAPANTISTSLKQLESEGQLLGGPWWGHLEPVL